MRDAYTPEAFAAATGASADQLSDLRRYQELVTAGQTRMNLVGPSALAEFWSRHALDSAQLFHVEPSARVWADIGSGAGFPGVVIAILLKGRPGAKVHLVESLGKRANFLREVCSELGLSTEVHQKRAEAMTSPDGLEVVSARACAPLPKLLEFTAHFMRRGAVGLFLKGQQVEAELATARKLWTLETDLIPSVSNPEGRILRIDRAVRRAG